MLTFERAAELVDALRKVNHNAAIDLFTHFDTFFDLSQRDDNGKIVSQFAEMCGYPIAQPVDEA
jgi:hypothetical protein